MQLKKVRNEIIFCLLFVYILNFNYFSSFPTLLFLDSGDKDLKDKENDENVSNLSDRSDEVKDEISSSILDQTEENIDDDILAEAEQLIESEANENLTKIDKKKEEKESSTSETKSQDDIEKTKDSKKEDKEIYELKKIDSNENEKIDTKVDEVVNDDPDKLTYNEKDQDIDTSKDEDKEEKVDSEKNKKQEIDSSNKNEMEIETSENVESSENDKKNNEEFDVEKKDEILKTSEKDVETRNLISNDDEEDLLISCEAPKVDALDEKLQKEADESSSNADDISDDLMRNNNDKDEEMKDDFENGESELKLENETNKLKTEENEHAAMETDETSETKDEKPSNKDIEEDNKTCLKQEDVKEKTGEIKLNFLRRFATATGKLSRPELEELLIEKITECFLFSSENATLRMRIEKQEMICESLKSRMESLKKQYNDLDMIHKRIMKDLSERPGSSITPVKITRAVGLQVYQPASSSQLKRKNEEIIGNLSKTSELKVITPEQKRRKVTPLRPALSETQKKQIEQKNMIEGQQLKEDITKTLINSQSVTLTARKSTSISNGSQSIDLTDEDDNIVSSYKNIPVNQQIQLPPALVAINPQTGARGYLVKVYPPPLPNAIILDKPGIKKFAPKPTISIIKTAQKNGIIVQWKIEGYDLNIHSEIKSYEIYAYEADSANMNSVKNWRRVGDVAALPLPMAITLTQFAEGKI